MSRRQLINGILLKFNASQYCILSLLTVTNIIALLDLFVFWVLYIEAL
jgi:hypothetical protein